MIIEYIRYDLTTHQPEDLVSAYAAAVEALRAAPECQAFELTQCEEARQSFTLRIEWLSTSAHLQGFRRGPHFGPFLAAIKPFIPEIAEMRHYSPTRSYGPDEHKGRPPQRRKFRRCVRLVAGG